MRTRAMMSYDEDGSSWRESTRMSDRESHMPSSRKEYNTYEQNVKTLASFLPDEIIQCPTNYNARNLEGATLFAEIQGFGELCEKYNKLPKSGTSRLTQVLNAYIGTFVQSIMSFNGDILKFSGQSVLAFWKAGNTSKDYSLTECIHQALDAALSLVKSHGRYETDIGVFLRIKTVISAGNVIFCLIGTEQVAQFVLVGLPIWEAKSGTEFAGTGETLISVSAWDFISFSEFVSERIESLSYVKILGITRHWRSTQRNANKDVVENLTSSLTGETDSQEEDSVKSSEVMHNVYELRPSIGNVLKQDNTTIYDLRKFIAPPVLRMIDREEGVDNLTEIRNIAVVIFHVEMSRADTVDYITTVDNCYKCISQIAMALDGCLNSLAFNDKDLHFTVIFGFQGFKHEMDSQRALFCGRRCFKEVLKLHFIKNVTVAVTAGLSFCGVIGHNLRREYSVIGLSITRAYAILGNCTNKICCDRQTFFHSKLEAANFVLLDSKSLKGMPYVGPIYEYIEYDSLADNKLIYNPYPILDRDSEMRAYFKTIYKLKSLQLPKDMEKRKALRKTSCLIIKAKQRQGRTRLTEEIMFCTPSEFPIFRLKLILADKKTPFHTIRLLFGVPLGLTEKSSLADRELKISSKLRNVYEENLLCVLNNVFKVNFPKSDVYMQLSETERLDVLIEAIKQLCLGCFHSIWVVVIDGGEYIDLASWQLLNSVAETYTVALVITLVSNSELNPEIAKIHKHPRYRILTLRPLDKWYQIGLACQLMNVHGIPAELETILMSKSNGSPGWVESYLVNLLQQNEIQIVQIPLAELEAYPLCIPPKDMMTRDMDTIDIKKVVDVSSPSNLDQKWKIFKDTYRDSTTIIENEIVILTGYNQHYAEEVHEKITKYGLNGQRSTVAVDSTVDSESVSENGSSISKNAMKQQFIDICQMTPGVKLSDVDPEYTIEAIQNLFEIGVLGCSGGEFSEEYQNAILNYPKVNPRDERIAVCRCEGLCPPAFYRTLPKYAYCGYLRFKIHFFRETTYETLPMDQKKDFHSKAMRYLEKKTKKCHSCGGGSLVKLMGVRYDQDIITRKAKNLKAHPNISERGSVNVLENWGQEQGRVHRSIYYLEKAINIRESRALKQSVINYELFTAPRSMRKLMNRESLVRTFSELNYNNCECYRILDSMYKQLIEHCEGADQMSKWMYAVLEYSSLCIDNYNRPLALKILFHALDVLEENQAALIEPEHTWKLIFIQAKIHTLIGKTRFESGQIDEALKVTLSALKTYGYNFPYKSEVKMRVIEVLQRMKLNYFVYPKAGNKRDYDAEYCDNVAECLILLTNIYIVLGQWCNAELAAIFSLENALQAEQNFQVILNAYTNVIITAIHLRKLNSILALELKALVYIKCYKGVIESNDLNAVYSLYSALFTARVLSGKLTSSIDIGRVVHRIYNSLPYKVLSFDVLPLYIQILILNDKHLDAVANIIDLGYATHHSEDIGLIWYYALCISFHLDTGFVILPVKLCESFLLTTNTYHKLNDTSAEKRYYTCVWLWFLRNGKFEEALLWKVRVENCWKSKKRENNIVNLFSQLYYLEGLLLSVINTMDTKSMITINNFYAEIDELITTLKKCSKIYNVIQARLYHLRALFAMIKEDNMTAMKYLKKGFRAAEYTGNTYDYNWLTHTELAWTRNMSVIQQKFWREHAEINNIDYRELEDSECKLAYYTFEPPIYE